MQDLRLVLLGPPAAGKGTQGRLMDERWHVPVTSSGEMLRAEIAAETPLGLAADALISKGSLVPDDIALQVVEKWLQGHGSSFVFDGFPRTIPQAQALDALLGKRRTPLQAVIWLEVTREEIEARVSQRVICRNCGRTFRVGLHVGDAQDVCPSCGAPLTVRNDDDPATLTRRMIEYEQHTAPLLGYYETRGLLHRIDGGQDAEAVFAQIESAVHQPAA